MVQALADIEPAKAASDWPFVSPKELGRAHRALDLLTTGARQETSWQTLNARQNGPTLPGEPEPASEKRGPSPLAAAYQQLFVGPQHLVAPPWGSVYTDRDCVVFGASTLELRTWMRSNGISMNTGESEPEDHLGLLLQQMAFLAENKPRLLDEFLRLHVLTWSHHYLEELVKAACEEQGRAGKHGQGHGEERSRNREGKHDQNRERTQPQAQAAEYGMSFYEGLALLTDLTLEGLHAARGLDVELPRFYR